ncbi:hypothetical protein [Natronoglomus mannanivorans]|uniref:Uncharacterized protein n=1 Tax=Natronoglomus mannanivorans TaxID=2979990 RepID=A0AAP3E0Q9_9EURY|nr:hypothetical protein [Halobacteria archaeon AArc-xg1-1]
MALDLGDWIAICAAVAGGASALVTWGNVTVGPPALWFAGGLVVGASVATKLLARRR